MEANDDDQEELKRRLWSDLIKDSFAIFPPQVDWPFVIRILEENENAVHWRDPGGVYDSNTTLLHAAVRKIAPTQVVRKIYNLWPGAISVAAGDGSLPVHVACRYSRSLEVRSLEVLRLLTQGEEGRQSLNTRNNFGQLPLHCHCRSRLASNQSIQFLIERGGPGTVRVADNEGRLPLHVAFEWRQQNPDRKIMCDAMIPLVKKTYPAAWTALMGQCHDLGYYQDGLDDFVPRLRLELHYRGRLYLDNEVIAWFEEVEQVNSIYTQLRKPTLDIGRLLQTKEFKRWFGIEDGIGDETAA